MNSADPSIEIASLKATIAALMAENDELRRYKIVLESLSAIDAARLKRMERLLNEATHGIAARTSGPGGTRSIDKF